MGYQINQNQTAQPLTFLLVLTSDHLSPATGKTPTVTISKNGGAFGSPAGAVSEIANGWYKVAGNATDANTLGPLLLHVTEASSDNTDDCFPVVVPVQTLVWQDATAGDFTVASSIGLSLFTGVAPGAAAGIVISSELITVAAIVTGIFQDTTAGNYTVAGSIGKTLVPPGGLGTIPGAAGGSFIAGANAATTVGGATIVTAGSGTNQLSLSGGRAAIQSGVTIGVAISGFQFPMVNTAGAPLPGLTVTAQRSINGAAYAPCTNPAAEVSAGTYQINLSASDMNGTTIKLLFTATGAAPTEITLVTTP
jgi:hypothetical protein